MYYAPMNTHAMAITGYSARIRSIRDGAQWSTPVFSDDLLAALRYVAELALWVADTEGGQTTSELVEVEATQYSQSATGQVWNRRIELQGTMQVAQCTTPSGFHTMAVADNGDVLVEWTS